MARWGRQANRWARRDCRRLRRHADKEILPAKFIDERVCDLRRVRRRVPALEVVGNRCDGGGVESAGRLCGVASEPLQFALRIGYPLVD